MTPLQEQFEILRNEEPGAECQRLGDGSYLIIVRGVELPDGWSKRIVEVRFIAPVGYPFGKPDCFWTDGDLRLANGTPPTNTNSNPIPHIGGGYLWFSWHVSSWDSNVDSLLTYFYVIKRRLWDPK
jgi:hypothetical protein